MSLVQGAARSEHLRQTEAVVDRAAKPRNTCPPAADEAHQRWPERRIKLVFAGAFLPVCCFFFSVTLVLWHQARPARGTFDQVLRWSSVLWVLLALPALANAAGIILFRHSHRSEEPDWPIDNLVSFRVVTRGDNVLAVRKTVAAIQAEIDRLPLFPYVIEVVTDTELELPPGDDVIQLCVPNQYRTLRGSKYKARALQYALEYSTLPPNTWLLHLDEETHITPSVILGVRRAVAEEERTGQLRIGQGAILYHRDFETHCMLTLADGLRTGDDLARFHLQHRFGTTVFGLHGSFILVRNDVEKEVGFDFGPVGSITEDAWWAMVQMQEHRRSRWVDGYCVEQCTRSVRDFLKQRRRWFIGLVLVAKHAPATRALRLCLCSSMVLWAVGWLGSVLAGMCLITGVRAPLPIYIVGNIAFSIYVALYILGLEVNLQQRKMRWHRRILWHLLQAAMTPLFSAMEAAAVIYAILRPERGFHVVQK